MSQYFDSLLLGARAIVKFATANWKQKNAYNIVNTVYTRPPEIAIFHKKHMNRRDVLYCKYA